MRVRLITLLELTAAAAIVLAVVTGVREDRSVTWQFAGLPPDDASLHGWLQEKGYPNMLVVRDGNQVTITRSGRGIPGGSLAFVTPPWERLGYGSPSVLRGSRGWTVFGGSVYPWLTILVVLISIHLAVKRAVRKRSATEGVDNIADQ